MIEIETLGDFVIRVNGNIVTEGFKKTTKLWKLLNLLIINKKKLLPVNAILESLWNEGDFPANNGTLHNLVYRLRELLSSEGAEDHIIFKNNCYMLQTGERLTVDVHCMEELHDKAANAELSVERRAELLRKAADLYKGEYTLGSFSSDIWSLSTVSRYKRMFTDIVGRLANDYFNMGDYDNLIEVCEKGIMLEPLEEIYYRYLVMALRKKDQNMQAITLCEDYFNLLYRELGVSASSKLNSMYKELKGYTMFLPQNVDYALDKLNEGEPGNQAFLCSFEAFKDIYRYETRRAARSGTAVFVTLISIADRNNDLPSPNALNDAMQRVQDCCMAILRKCDVIAEYSQTQMILMLTDIDVRFVCKIVSRIQEQVSSMLYLEDVSIRFDGKAALIEI